jgi:hypothetical protein
MSKWLEADGEKVGVEMKVTDELNKLLKKFAIKEDETYCGNFPNVSRYLVKSVLMRDVNWSNVFELLFSCDVIEKKKIVFNKD